MSAVLALLPPSNQSMMDPLPIMAPLNRPKEAVLFSQLMAELQLQLLPPQDQLQTLAQPTHPKEAASFYQSMVKLQRLLHQPQDQLPISAQLSPPRVEVWSCQSTQEQPLRLPQRLLKSLWPYVTRISVLWATPSVV